MISHPDRVGPQEVRRVDQSLMMDPIYNLLHTDNLRVGLLHVTLEEAAKEQSEFYVRDIVTNNTIVGCINTLVNYADNLVRTEQKALITPDTSNEYQLEYTRASRRREEIVEDVSDTLIRNPLWRDIDYDNAINSAARYIYIESPEFKALEAARQKAYVSPQLIPVAELEMLEQ